MDGDTTDLQDKASFSMEIAKIMQGDMNLPNVEHNDIIRLMGIKRTNASTLLTGQYSMSRKSAEDLLKIC